MAPHPADSHEPPRIELNNASVVYEIQRERASQLRNMGAQILGLTKAVPGSRHNAVRALNGLNVTIRAGERVGIIGRNGAGKSTLLKLIAGVIPPHEGLVSVTGTIQGLFDIGVGLEAESTGRENIFFRSLLQGLSPEMAREREAEIVTFSGLGAFIDQPVKTYSSGMTVRLAYAIATYLEGNVLLIDEIFGAGDNQFQTRAIERMRQVLSKANIVVFTSHNLSLLSEICDRGIWLDSGKIAFDGPMDEAISTYLESDQRRRKA